MIEQSFSQSLSDIHGTSLYKLASQAASTAGSMMVPLPVTEHHTARTASYVSSNLSGIRIKLQVVGHCQEDRQQPFADRQAVLLLCLGPGQTTAHQQQHAVRKLFAMQTASQLPAAARHFTEKMSISKSCRLYVPRQYMVQGICHVCPILLLVCKQSAFRACPLLSPWIVLHVCLTNH